MAERLFVNPFRARAIQGRELILGGVQQRRIPRQEALRFLLEAETAREEEVAALPEPLAGWLREQRFLVPYASSDDHRLSRQLGFFSFWPGDPALRQQRLRGATVAILGVGGLGSQVAMLLAAAGVGTLRLCDGDRVERSNLNRQLLYEEGDVGRPKVRVAEERLARMNPETAVEPVARRLATTADVRAVAHGADVVVRAIDTPPDVGFVVNEACRGAGVPHVGGGFVETWAVAGPFVGADGPCLRCTMAPPALQFPRERRGATFAPLTFWLSSYVAGDVLRVLAGLGEPWLHDRMVMLDGATGASYAAPLRPLPGPCPVCGRDAGPAPVPAAGEGSGAR